MNFHEAVSVYVFPFISTVLCELQSLTRTKTAPPTGYRAPTETD